MLPDLPLPVLSLILLIVFASALLIQLFYYWFFYSRLAFFRAKPGSEKLEPVSVVIAAYNDAHKLKRNLLSILTQDYPDYEVIVVNDRSDDDTKETVLSFAETYPHLKLVNVTQSVIFFRSKKFPLSVGIKSAKNEILLLTDADCHPVSNQWIRQMQASYTDRTEIVLGYGPYEKTGGLLNLLIRYDAYQIAIQYFSFALAKLPYMGVGRNLSYRKSLFYRQKGFISHYNIPSGDDDLFIKSAATKTNTHIQIHPDSVVFSESKKTFGSWFKQKRRHFSTGKYYKPSRRFLLGLQAVSNIFYYASLASLLALQIYWPIVLGAHGFRLLNRMLLYGYCSKKLSQKKLFLFSPLLEPFFTLFNPILFLSGVFVKSRKWK